MPFIVFILSLLILQPAYAQKPPDERVLAIDKALSRVETKKNPSIWEEAHADKPYIGLLSEYELKLNDDWSYEENYHARVKIQKEAAKELGEWPVYYNKSREQILEVKAFVETPDGKRQEATQIQDLQTFDDAPMYSDMRLKMITLPEVNVGTVIDVQVKSKTLRKDMPNHFWDKINYPQIPTKYLRHTYIFPEGKAIAYKAYKSDLEPIVDKKGGVVKYSFIFENTQYTEDEEFMPPIEEVEGVVSLSSIKDWKEVADWYRGLVGKNMQDDDLLSAKALELSKDKVTQKEKVRALMEFIQDNFRYVSMSLGDHTVEPHPTVDVFRNKYGDCKDLAILAKQMLKVMGIEANICLFSGEFNGNPKHSLPNPNVFDHVILQVNADGQSYFVDPQTKGFDLGQLPSTYDNAYVLVIGDKEHHFETLPVMAEADRAVMSSSDVIIKEDGSALYEVRVQMPLEASQSFKESWADTTNNNKEKFFESMEANFTQGGKMIDKNIKGLDSRYGPVEFSLKYESPNAYPVINDMILLKEVPQGDLPDFSAARRVYPIFMPNNSLIQNRNVYHIPDGLKVDFVPKDYSLSLDFIEMANTYLRSEDKITVDSIFRFKRATMEASRYGEVKLFRDELYKKSDQYIVLKKKSIISNEAKDWVKKQ